MSQDQDRFSSLRTRRELNSMSVSFESSEPEMPLIERQCPLKISHSDRLARVLFPRGLTLIQTRHDSLELFNIPLSCMTD